MLREIIDLFKERKTISLSDLSIHFKTDESAMLAMLKPSKEKVTSENCTPNAIPALQAARGVPLQKRRTFIN